MPRSTQGSSRGPAPSGVVHGPDGRPARRAEAVILSTSHLEPSSTTASSTRGPTPRYHRGRGPVRLPSPDRAVSRVRLSRKRLCRGGRERRSPVRRSSTQPWGRIEGTVKIGARPAAGTLIFLSESNPLGPRRGHADPAKPSNSTPMPGAATYLSEVIPTELSVSRGFTLERLSSSVGTGDSRNVVVEPDKTTWVNLGGTCCPVVGRFVLPSGIKPSAVSWRQPDTGTDSARASLPPEGLNRQGARGPACGVVGD